MWDVSGDQTRRRAVLGAARATRTSRRSRSRTSSRRRIRRIASISSAPCRKAVATGDEFDVEYRVPVPDGGVRWIAARGRAEKGRRHQMLGVAVDVTERKLAELRAVEDRNALRHMTRVSMLGQLSASIAHQLNQPLAAILGNAEAARKMLARERVDLAELREICDDIVAEDNRAAEVIRAPRRAVQARRHEDGAARLQRADSRNARSAARRVADPPRHAAHRTGAGAAGRRRRARAAAAGVAQPRPQCRRRDERSRRREAKPRDPHRSDRRGRSHCIVVDNGPGIPERDLKRVFDPFWSTKAGGMGIGLAICQSIVAAHHGTHHGNQQRGRRHDVLRQPAGGGSDMTETSAAPTIFLVDDDPERAEGAVARAARGRLGRRDVRVGGSVPRTAAIGRRKGASCST